MDKYELPCRPCLMELQHIPKLIEMNTIYCQCMVIEIVHDQLAILWPSKENRSRLLAIAKTIGYLSCHIPDSHCWLAFVIALPVFQALHVRPPSYVSLAAELPFHHAVSARAGTCAHEG